MNEVLFREKSHHILFFCSLSRFFLSFFIKQQVFSCCLRWRQKKKKEFIAIRFFVNEMRSINWNKKERKRKKTSLLEKEFLFLSCPLRFCFFSYDLLNITHYAYYKSTKVITISEAIDLFPSIFKTELTCPNERHSNPLVLNHIVQANSQLVPSFLPSFSPWLIDAIHWFLFSFFLSSSIKWRDHSFDTHSNTRRIFFTIFYSRRPPSPPLPLTRNVFDYWTSSGDCFM